MAAPSAPAGWYPDPTAAGFQRYWDGVQWTEHAAPLAPSAPGDSRGWAVGAHLSALAGLVIGLSFLGPLVVYLLRRGEDPFVRDQAAEALNFNLSVLIYEIALGIAMVLLFIIVVGILLLLVMIGMAIAWLVLTIVAATKASRGERYRYPLTIRFVS